MAVRLGSKPGPEMFCVYQFKVVLRGISPMIWRRVLLRSDHSIADLHYTIQIAMGWSDSHLHRFHIHGKDYGVAQEGGLTFSDDPKRVLLAQFGLTTPTWTGYRTVTPRTTAQRKSSAGKRAARVSAKNRGANCWPMWRRKGTNVTDWSKSALKLIAQALDLKLQICVGDGFVVKVAILFPFHTVAELQGAALGLVPGRVGVRRIAGKIETLQRCVAGASLAGEQEPRLFLLRAGVKELELGVRDPAIVLSRSSPNIPGSRSVKTSDAMECVNRCALPVRMGACRFSTTR